MLLACVLFQHRAKGALFFTHKGQVCVAVCASSEEDIIHKVYCLGTPERPTSLLVCKGRRLGEDFAWNHKGFYGEMIEEARRGFTQR